MRHRVKGKILDRKSGPRAALMRGLATSLVIYEKIQTTEAKAKAIKPIVEKYITASKKNDLATRRKLLGFFYWENAVKKMLEVIGPRYKDRKGGYTRILKLGTRPGDRAKIVQLELV
ncbi:50S ribosomal protein L17 [Candidatus Uhrbacteria bacterium]|nr:50S ribosomal protein L17 [Candidatus Uhrbacteria bacterium]